MISELVTDAVRHGAEPRRSRLLRDGTSLDCEVADGSSTSPHLRRAADTDEGGRGLFHITRLTQRGAPVAWPTAAVRVERRGLVITVRMSGPA